MSGTSSASPPAAGRPRGPLHFLTIQQPWAVAISHGGKQVENRTWPTRYRGPLAIHAGKRDDKDGWATPLIATVLDDMPDGLLPRGAVVAVAQLVGCHRAARSWPTCCQPWGVEEQFHFELADVQALTEPVELRGALGIQRVPADIAALIAERLA